jgi:hypothetical protein
VVGTAERRKDEIAPHFDEQGGFVTAAANSVTATKTSVQAAPLPAHAAKNEIRKSGLTK